jgi:hypothetical protein
MVPDSTHGPMVYVCLAAVKKMTLMKSLSERPADWNVLKESGQ